MADVVYTLKISEKNEAFVIVAFSTVSALWARDNPFVIAFMPRLRIVLDELFVLFEQAKPGQREIRMTEKQLIIYYAVLNITCKAYGSEKMMAQLNTANETPEELKIVHLAFSAFTLETCSELKQRFSHLQRFIKATQMIDLVNAAHFG
jgi:hypothetical protein